MAVVVTFNGTVPAMVSATKRFEKGEDWSFIDGHWKIYDSHSQELAALNWQQVLYLEKVP